MEILEEEAESEAGDTSPIFRGEIEFDQVRFRYPTRPEVEVLKEVSFHVKPGEKVALAGHSGAGKSTIIQLLSRFYEVENGSIQVDDRDVKDWDLKSLRGKIGIVPQEVLLFGGSIRENIAYAKPDASEEEIVLAAKKANGSITSSLSFNAEVAIPRKVPQSSSEITTS